jgi:hypothetical protein
MGKIRLDGKIFGEKRRFFADFFTAEICCRGDELPSGKN